MIFQDKSFIYDELFVVMLGDKFIESDLPVTKQLMDVYEVNGVANIGIIEVPKTETDKYEKVDVDQEVSKDVFCFSHTK